MRDIRGTLNVCKVKCHTKYIFESDIVESTFQILNYRSMDRSIKKFARWSTC